MKKEYTTPEVEKVEFNYREQVVASPVKCIDRWVNTGDGSCTDDNKYLETVN